MRELFPDLFKEPIYEMSDDELTQFIQRIRHPKAEQNQAAPDQPEMPPCIHSSSNSPYGAAPVNPDEPYH